MKGKFLNLLFIIVMGSFLLNLSMFVVARVLYNAFFYVFCFGSVFYKK